MKKIFIIFLFFFLLVAPAFANNLVISNATLEDRNASANTMVVQFNISWDHSWRKNDGRHDAAWVFVKLYQNSTAPWLHGKLYTAGTNPTGTSPGTNSDLKIVVPTDKIGAFILRTATGSGSFSSQKVRLVVDYGSSGLADTDTVTAKVFGIEMVYVPEGPFYIGGETHDLNETPGSVYGIDDASISVFNSAGTFQWSKRLGGTEIGLNMDAGKAIITNSVNNVIIAGHVYGNADLNGDGDTADSNESGAGVYGTSSDAFISVFNSAGTFQWSKRLGGTNNDSVSRVVVDSGNNIIVGGTVNGNVDLNGDGDTADTNEATGGVYSSFDAFISVFNSAGTFLWSKRLGGTTSDLGNAVTVDSSNNNVILGGGVTEKVDLNGDAALTASYAFYQNGYEDTAPQITTTATSISVDTNSNDDIDTSPVTVTGGSGITGNTSWPNGYDDFYAMKYEITQGQYVDFLNTLSRVQQQVRVASSVGGDTIANYYVITNETSVIYRQGIRAPASGNGTSPTTVVFGNDFNANGVFNESDDGQNIAMNFVSWMDNAAYADWAGLRPMTELEFEKMTRGPNSAVYGEYAWGTTKYTTVTSLSGTGRGSETSVEKGEGLSLTSLDGPLRVGFAATNATNRKSAAAGYYGNMNLSDNVWEFVVSLGLSVGRAFSGTHGDGTLVNGVGAAYDGNATNNDWPGINGTVARGVTSGSGTGRRGGSYSNIFSVSYRGLASSASSVRSDSFGIRAVRTAP